MGRQGFIGLSLAHDGRARPPSAFNPRHWVKESAASVLIMPGEDVEQRTLVHDRRFRGGILPTPHGAMAVLGERPEPIEQSLERLRSALGWSA
jgi:hypothetical protein